MRAPVQNPELPESPHPGKLELLATNAALATPPTTAPTSAYRDQR
jgi:hypothetical protein